MSRKMYQMYNKKDELLAIRDSENYLIFLLNFLWIPIWGVLNRTFLGLTIFCLITIFSIISSIYIFTLITLPWEIFSSNEIGDTVISMSKLGRFGAMLFIIIFLGLISVMAGALGVIKDNNSRGLSLYITLLAVFCGASLAIHYGSKFSFTKAIYEIFVESDFVYLSPILLHLLLASVVFFFRRKITQFMLNVSGFDNTQREGGFLWAENRHMAVQLAVEQQLNEEKFSDPSS